MGTYLITGSASGIGAATRARLERAGHQVVGVDLADAEITADLGQPDTRAAAVAEATERCAGGLDGMVTAAGVGPPFDPAAMISINYFGSEAFLTGMRPLLAAGGDAQVVAISSNSTTTSPNVPDSIVAACLDGDEEQARALATEYTEFIAYPGSKIAIARYVRRNAPTADWAGSGIRLNAIAPGATQTPLLQAGLDSAEFGDAIRNFSVPTGGFGTADQIAAWIEHMLCGDGAAFMCGSIVFVDGGTDALVRPDDWPVTFHMEF